MSDINIIETILDKNSFFNIKRFTLKGLGKDFPIKTINVNNISKKVFEDNRVITNKNLIFEKSKTIKKFQDVVDIMEETKDSKINDFFGRRAWLDNKFTLFHATLKFNPYEHIKKVEEISGFLDYYYSHSKHIVLIPNVLKRYTPYDEEGKASKTEIEVISIKNYIRLVDELYEFFEQMNNKPIFVPIALRKLSMSEITELINHYLEKEMFYFWIDFESAPADLSKGNLGGKIGQINRLLRNSKQFDKCIILATNIKREIISNSKNDKSPASDILTTLCGANLVGVDKDPQRGFKIEDEEKRKKIVEHKSRVFDENTYYYNIRREIKPNRVLNITSNSVKLASEFKKQEEHFLKELEIKNYLKTKDMLNKYNNGKILKSLFVKSKELIQRRLF